MTHDTRGVAPRDVVGEAVVSSVANAEQETEELGDNLVARMNPKTGAVQSLEVLFFSTRLLRSDLFELPVTAEPRRAN